MLLSQQYALQVKPGEVLTRSQFADRVGRSKTTAFIQHIERAVYDGLLHKAEFYIGNNVGWGYALPDTMRELIDGQPQETLTDESAQGGYDG